MAKELSTWLRLRALLLAGPCLAVLLPAIGWGSGYRLSGLIGSEVLIFLAVVGVWLILMILALLSVLTAPVTSPGFGRSVAAVALLVLVLPIYPSIEFASAHGRACLERQLGLDNLGRDCVALFEAHIAVRDEGFLSADKVNSPAIRRLRPVYIQFHSDRVWIALHGGFEHYGYELVKDAPNGRWLFRWYHVEGGADRTLRSWPIGSNP